MGCSCSRRADDAEVSQVEVHVQSSTVLQAVRKMSEDGRKILDALPQVRGRHREVSVSSEARKLSLLAPSERPHPILCAKLDINPELQQPITQQYRFEEVLGRGAFGEVIRGLHLETEKSYAIKMLDAKTLKPGNIRGEVKILKELRHPNVIHLREIFATEEYVYLVMEYAKGGALVDVVVKDGKLSESFTAACVMQVASALEFMHANGVVHRDIKPENVLVSDIKTRLVKVCDFGLSKIFNGFRTPLLSGKGGSRGDGSFKADSGGDGSFNGTSGITSGFGRRDVSPGNSGVASPHTYSLNDRSLVMKSRVGSQFYASPEVITGQATYDHSVDLWGLGLIMHILITGKHPFADAIDWYGSLVAGKVDCDAPVWSQISPSATDLVRALLRAKPADRITAREVLDHPWMVDGMSNNRRLEQSLAYLNVFRKQQVRAVAMKVLQTSLTEQETYEIHLIFDCLDVEQKGYLTHDDVEAALADKAHKQLGRASIDLPPNVGRFNIRRLLRRLHQTSAIRKQQVITFEMFLRAVLETDDELVHEHLLRVFQQLDEAGTGFVHADDVQKTLQDFGLDADGMVQARTMLVAAANEAKKLSYDAFVDILLREQRDLAVQDLLLRDFSTRNSSFEASSSRKPPSPVRLTLSSPRDSVGPSRWSSQVASPHPNRHVNADDTSVPWRWSRLTSSTELS